MKKIIIACTLAIVGLHGNAFAQPTVCNGSTVQNVGTFISGKQICASDNGERWQEYHQGGPSGGDLIDYKLGSSSSVDPTAKVGTWSASGSELTHIYDTRYTYVLQPSSNPNRLCNTSSGKIYRITILSSGPSPCN